MSVSLYVRLAGHLFGELLLFGTDNLFLEGVGGIGYGQMIIELPPSQKEQKTIIDFFTNGGLAVSEVG